MGLSGLKCEWKSIGVKVKGLEWNEVDVGVNLVEGMEGFMWNELNVNVSLVE
jgi:hypothetical protein